MIHPQPALVVCSYWAHRILPESIAHKIPCAFCLIPLVIERSNWGFGLAICIECILTRFKREDLDFGGGIVGGVHYPNVKHALLATDSIFRRN